MAPLNDVDLEKGPAPQDLRRTVSLGVDFKDAAPGMILPGMDYAQRLFHYTYSIAEDRMFFMEFRLLQRLNLIDLQNELARSKAAVWKGMEASKSDLQTLRVTMHEYGESSQYLERLGTSDREEMEDYRAGQTDAFEEIASEPADPYNSNYRFLENPPKTVRFDFLRDSLRRMLPRSLAYSSDEKRRRILQYLANKPPTEIGPGVDMFARAAIAFVSGASLIVPMVVMSLDKSLTKSLVTTSIAVLILAGFLAFVIRTLNVETILATTTYAAVLVIFVGAGS